MIVGICGLIGSGKGTAAEYLVAHHGFTHESFAAPLKDAVAAVFDWPRDLLEGDTSRSRCWREEIDTWWAERLGIPTLTPRWVLQNWGTDVLRENFHDDIWIAACERRLQSAPGDVVISDCRFPNEIESLRQLGARIIRVKRGPDPDWFCAAELLNTLPAVSPDARGARIILDTASVHWSEVAWAGQRFDLVIPNDGDLTELYARIDDYISG